MDFRHNNYSSAKQLGFQTHVWSECVSNPTTQKFRFKMYGFQRLTLHTWRAFPENLCGMFFWHFFVKKIFYFAFLFTGYDCQRNPRLLHCSNSDLPHPGKGSSINDVTQIWRFSMPPPPSVSH